MEKGGPGIQSILISMDSFFDFFCCRQCSSFNAFLGPWVGNIPGEGNGNPLQYSCLESSTERRTWRATRASSANTRGFHTQLDEGPETPRATREASGGPPWTGRKAERPTRRSGAPGLPHTNAGAGELEPATTSGLELRSLPAAACWKGQRQRDGFCGRDNAGTAETS